MIRILSLGLVLLFAPVGSGVATTFSVPLRQLRPFPTLLRTLGVAPVPDGGCFADGERRRGSRELRFGWRNNQLDHRRCHGPADHRAVDW